MRRTATAILFGLACAAILGHEYLVLWEGTYTFRGAMDWTMVHQPAVHILHDALRGHGALPYWTELLQGGTPFFAIPDKPFLYPPMLLGVLAWEPFAALDRMAWLHLLLGAAGVQVLVVALGLGAWPALLAAVLFGLGAARDMFFGTPFWGFALAWTPWIVALWIGVCRRGHARALDAVVLGLLWSLQILAGGVFTFYHQVLLLVPLLLAGCMGRRGLPWREAGRLILPAAMLFLSLAALRAIPALAWASQTNRGMALPGDETVGITFDVAVNYPWFLKRIGMVALGLSAAGIFFRGRNRWVVGLLGAAALTLVFTSGRLHEVFAAVLPGLDRMRHVSRASWILALALCVLAAYGAAAIVDAIRGARPGEAGGARGAGIAATLAGAGLVALGWATSFDRVAGARLWNELDPALGLTESNWLMKELAILRRREGWFRIHQLESHGNVPRTGQAATVPMGFELLTGQVGNVWYPRYQRYLDRAIEAPARFWGAFGVRYVSARGVGSIEGLDLVKTVPRTHDPSPKFAGGPQLFRVPVAVPRAYAPPRAVLLVGPEERTSECAMDLLADPRVPLGKTGIVQADARALALGGVGLLRCIDLLLFLEEPGEASAEVLAWKLRDHGEVLDVRGGPGSEGFEQAAEICASWATEPEPIEVPLRWVGPNEARLDVTDLDLDADPRVVILAEKFSLFPGWLARAGEGRVRIRPAFSIQSAIAPLPRWDPLPPSPGVAPGKARREIVFTYRPPGFATARIACVFGLLVSLFVLRVTFRGRAVGPGGPRA